MASLIEFTRRFSTPEVCLKHLGETRWKDGAYRPNRGCADRIHHHGDKRRHKCENRKRIFRIITGTMVSDSPINMPPKWFAAVRLDTRHRKGIPSMRLSRDIGVTRKTTWRMLRRIGHAVGEVTGMLGGEVDIDEPHIGGKEKNKRAKGARGRGVKTNTVAFGMRARGGDAKAVKIGSAAASDVMPHMLGNVALGANVHAHDHRGHSLLDEFHELDRVNHSAGEDVRDDRHTSGIESFRALVKRACAGVHHHWSKKYTQVRLDGRAFRLNAKGMDAGDGAIRLPSKRMNVGPPYGELIQRQAMWWYSTRFSRARNGLSYSRSGARASLSMRGNATWRRHHAKNRRVDLNPHPSDTPSGPPRPATSRKNTRSRRCKSG